MQAQELEYVGFFPRLGATIIDTLLIVAITLPILHMYYGPEYWLDTRWVVGRVDLLVNYVFPFVAVVWFWRARQATPGKMLIGARVVDANTGEPLSVGQCVARYLGYFVSAVVVGLGYLWVLGDRRRQGWHDKIAGSVVVRSRNRDAEPVRFPEQ